MPHDLTRPEGPANPVTTRRALAELLATGELTAIKLDTCGMGPRAHMYVTPRMLAALNPYWRAAGIETMTLTPRGPRRAHQGTDVDAAS